MFETDLNIITKTIQEILSHEKDNLEDAILSCLTNLNLLQNFTDRELGMTTEEVKIDSKKEADRIDEYVSSKGKIEHWLTLIDESEDGEEKYKELIFEELPWIEKRLRIL